MARIRTIKPEAFSSETLSQLPIPVRWTFVGLWTYADDEGRARDDARLVKAAVYPLDDDVTVRKIETHLAQLADRGLIRRYKVDGRSYLLVTGFLFHQRVNRPTASVYPPPDEDSMSAHGVLTEDAVSDTGARTEDSLRARKERKGTGKGTGNPPGGAPAPRRPAPDPPDEINTSHVVAAWVEGATEMAGERPAARLIGQIGRQARELLGEGKDPPRLVEAARNAGRKGFADLGRELLKAGSPNGRRPVPDDDIDPAQGRFA